MDKYYTEIDKILKEYEDNKSYHIRNIDWACDRIVWCWKWKKITQKQMEELADRATVILDKKLN